MCALGLRLAPPLSRQPICPDARLSIPVAHPASLSRPLFTTSAGHGGGKNDWVLLAFKGRMGADGRGTPVAGTVLGKQQGTSAASFQVDESSRGQNGPFFAQVFGAGKADRRLFIVLKHEGKLAVDTPFKQSWRSDTASVVERHAHVVFTCLRSGEGVFSA